MSAPAATLRPRVFALTWLSYASYYLTRKNFSVAKKTIERELHVDRAALGWIDTGYLTAYALGQLASGLAGDRIGARRLLLVGMLGTAACSIAFGGSSSFLLFGLIFALNGLAQSTGWPSNVKLMAEWFDGPRRGRVMGLWATNYQLGGLVANPVAGALIARFGWRAAFVIPGLYLIVVGLLVFAGLPRDPASRGGAVEEADGAAVAAARRRVLTTPLVWALGGTYFFLKLIRYVLLFWLPYFMEAEDGLGYGATLAAGASLAFEAGGAVGAVVIGWASDRLFPGRRLVVSLVCIVALAGALVLYGRVAAVSVAANLGALALVGFLLFGPDSLLSGAAAQDLGGPLAAGTAAGLINALGSLGAIAQGYVTAHLSRSLGWGGLFAALGGGALVGALVLAPFALRRHSHRPR